MADPTPAPCAAAPSSHPPPSPHTGTTIVAATFPGGVVIGADSRVSTGAYVSNRASDKLHRITDDGSVWLLRSGSAADCQAIGDAGESDGRCVPPPCPLPSACAAPLRKPDRVARTCG